MEPDRQESKAKLTPPMRITQDIQAQTNQPLILGHSPTTAMADPTQSSLQTGLPLGLQFKKWKETIQGKPEKVLIKRNC